MAVVKYILICLTLFLVVHGSAGLSATSCYGSQTCDFYSLICPADDIISLTNLTVGRKNISICLNALEHCNSTATCCSLFDTDRDLEDFNLKNAFDTYTNCSGRSSCTRQQSPWQLMTISQTSTFVHLEYECQSRSEKLSFCGTSEGPSTATGQYVEVLFDGSRERYDPLKASKECQCTITNLQSSAQLVDVELKDVRMFTYTRTNGWWDCSSARFTGPSLSEMTCFNATDQVQSIHNNFRYMSEYSYTSDSEEYMTLTDIHAQGELDYPASIWVSLQGTSGDIEVSCQEVIPADFTTTSTSTTTTTTSTTTTSTTTTTPKPTTTTTTTLSTTTTTTSPTTTTSTTTPKTTTTTTTPKPTTTTTTPTTTTTTTPTTTTTTPKPKTTTPQPTTTTTTTTKTTTPTPTTATTTPSPTTTTTPKPTTTTTPQPTTTTTTPRPTTTTPQPTTTTSTTTTSTTTTTTTTPKPTTTTTTTPKPTTTTTTPKPTTTTTTTTQKPTTTTTPKPTTTTTTTTLKPTTTTTTTPKPTTTTTTTTTPKPTTTTTTTPIPTTTTTTTTPRPTITTTTTTPRPTTTTTQPTTTTTTLKPTTTTATPKPTTRSETTSSPFGQADGRRLGDGIDDDKQTAQVLMAIVIPVAIFAIAMTAFCLWVFWRRNHVTVKLTETKRSRRAQIYEYKDTLPISEIDPNSPVVLEFRDSPEFSRNEVAGAYVNPVYQSYHIPSRNNSPRDGFHL